jgi:hypothetical protein
MAAPWLAELFWDVVDRGLDKLLVANTLGSAIPHVEDNER